MAIWARGKLECILVLCALFAAFARAGAAHPELDFYEPDDHPHEARWIDTDGSPQSHTFHTQDDTDYVQFRAEAGSTVTIEVLYLTDGCDTVLYLYDPDGRQIGYDDDGGFGRASRLRKVLPVTGRYQARIALYGGTEHGHDGCSYDLRIALEDPPPPDRFEPDDTSRQAHWLLTDGTLQPHTLHVPLDRDWVKVEVPAGSLLTVETLHLRNDCDTVLTLYDPELNKIAQSDDYSGSDRSLIRRILPEGGSYYARVHHAEDEGQRGRAYSLRARIEAPQVGGLLGAPQRVGFPRVRVGATVTRYVTLLNRSETEILAVAAAAPEGAFSLAKGPVSFQLPPRRRHRLAVRFRPTTVGPASGELVLNTSDPSQPAFRIALSGRGR